MEFTVTAETKKLSELISRIYFENTDEKPDGIDDLTIRTAGKDPFVLGKQYTITITEKQ